MVTVTQEQIRNVIIQFTSGLGNDFVMGRRRLSEVLMEEFEKEAGTPASTTTVDAGCEGEVGKVLEAVSRIMNGLDDGVDAKIDHPLWEPTRQMLVMIRG